ncbi:hypothetical protein FACS1894203_1370 [Bacteroidia bacterium]|nr:hypothetical protein FACS1894203_1370 [Bacteroidia bacterium]
MLIALPQPRIVVEYQIITINISHQNADLEAVKVIEDGAETVQKGGAETITIQEQNILALIRNENTISRKSIAKQLGIGTTTVYRHIESLKEKGILERIGGDRGGYWKVNQ